MNAWKFLPRTTYNNMNKNLFEKNVFFDQASHIEKTIKHFYKKTSFLR